MTFARVLGRDFVTNTVEAITRVQGATTAGVFNPGAGLYSVKNDNSDKCFLVNGSANLTLHDSGVFVNCTGSSALFLNGGAIVYLDADAEVAGCTNNPGFPISGGGTIQCTVPQETVGESTFAGMPTVDPTPTCCW